MPLARSAIALGVLLAAVAPTAPPPAPLAMSPCELEHPLRLAAFAAECGVLNVAENPSEPHGRQIGLHVARIGAISRRKQPDPLFVLAGGPGAAAGAFYAAAAPAFARIVRERDIVLVDQRGTGGSNALDCAQPEERGGHESEKELVARTRECLASLTGHADVRYYTTSLAVSDLEAVRAALGYERINLYGASYGTRVAQQYIRHFPAHTRSVVLDGVVPVEEPMGLTTALDAEAALDDILRRCADEPACRERFGDPAADYRAVRTALKVSTVPISVPDPLTTLRVEASRSPSSQAAPLPSIRATAGAYCVLSW